MSTHPRVTSNHRGVSPRLKRCWTSGLLQDRFLLQVAYSRLADVRRHSVVFFMHAWDSIASVGKMWALKSSIYQMLQARIGAVSNDLVGGGSVLPIVGTSSRNPSRMVLLVPKEGSLWHAEKCIKSMFCRIVN